jgi:hypothetical protein
MHTIHIGYSESIDDQKFFRLLDPNYCNEQNKSEIELYFDCNYIRPGCFECYSIKDYRDNWSEDFIRKIFPFNLPEQSFKCIELSNTKIVFFIESDCDFFAKQHPDLIFLKRMEIEKYFYEK